MTNLLDGVIVIFAVSMIAGFCSTLCQAVSAWLARWQTAQICRKIDAGDIGWLRWRRLIAPPIEDYRCECHGLIIIHAIYSRQVEIVDILLYHISANAAGPRDTLATAAARTGSLPMLNLLAEHGAVLNFGNATHETPLLIAVGRNDLAMVRRLLELRADPNGDFRHDLTPVMLACRRGYADIVEVLLAAGANRAHLIMPEGNVYHLRQAIDKTAPPPPARRPHAEIQAAIAFETTLPTLPATVEGLRDMFECTICHGPVVDPAHVNTCPQQMMCMACVTSWLRAHDVCPITHASHPVVARAPAALARIAELVALLDE